MDRRRNGPQSTIDNPKSIDRPTLAALGLFLATASLAVSMQTGRYAPRLVMDRMQRACEKGDLGAVRRLLDEGESPNFRTYAGQTALGIAVMLNRWPVAETLLARGADPDALVYGMPLVRVMALSGDWSGYDWLLKRGAKRDAEADRLARTRPR